jgi:hypothetical protein
VSSKAAGLPQFAVTAAVALRGKIVPATIHDLVGDDAALYVARARGPNRQTGNGSRCMSLVQFRWA